MGFVKQAARVRLEWAVHRAGRSAGISAWHEIFAASAFGIVADGEIARDQINLFPIFVDKGRRREHPGRKTQQTRAAAAPVPLVKRSRQDLLLNASRIAAWC